jgi:hypothetical protein
VANEEATAKVKQSDRGSQKMPAWLVFGVFELRSEEEKLETQFIMCARGLANGMKPFDLTTFHQAEAGC